MREIEKNIWPGWDVIQMLGRGSFGAVYEIQRENFGIVEKAALKVISIPQNDGDIDELYSDGYDEESITSTFRSRLESVVAEYSMMRQMNGCANIVNSEDIRYIQHEDGIGWDILIKMELLTPLTKLVQSGVSEEEIIKLAKDMCNALKLCKMHGIVHRDIKPQNIFVSEHGDYKLGDFGIAKTIEGTMGGTKIGTYKYMAPEVYNNQPYGSSSDVYSLGLVLYWLLNERRMPFMPLPPTKMTSGIEENARQRRMAGEVIPAPAHGSAALKRVVLKACAFHQSNRYRTAEEMLEDLCKLETKPKIAPAPVPKGNPVSDKFVYCKQCGHKNPVESRFCRGCGAQITAGPNPPNKKSVQKPATQQPPVQKPATQQPPVQKPATQQPLVQKPATQQPLVQKPEEKKGTAEAFFEQRDRKKKITLISTGVGAVVLVVLLIIVLRACTGGHAFSGHKMEKTWTSLNGRHYHACSEDSCDYVANEESCHGGTATCTTRAVCVVCNKCYGTSLPCDFSSRRTEERYLKTAANCHAPAEYYFSCLECGKEGMETFISGEVDPQNHVFTSFVSNNDATYESDGTMTAKCDYCGAVDTFIDEGSRLKMTGWRQEDEEWYYYNDGVMQTGHQTIDGKSYFFLDDGRMYRGWGNQNGTYSYYKQDGTMAIGWLQVNNQYYYFKEDGVMAVGWVEMGGAWYYFLPTGEMATGHHQIDGTWYYFSSEGPLMQ